MTIKAGHIVSHEGALEWGAGKVLEVTALMATIQFSDGKSRKIAASHYDTLKPTAATSYVPPTEPVPVVKAARLKKPVKKITSPAKDA